MKVCKFCGAECPDSDSFCSACGGNEFKHKCNNCGNVFDDGNFCPKCGVKVGKQSKICPVCGAEYYSFACPDCGYTPTENNTSNNNVYYPPQNVYQNNYYTQPVKPVKKKRKTLLWVLGWIYMFPVPLTILMLRKKEMHPLIRYGIIAAGWIVYLLCVISSGSGQ